MFRSPARVIAQQVNLRGPSSRENSGAIPDIIEAGNCYALNRPTACVFHLMRVIPYGMAALTKLLKVKLPKPIDLLEWQAIIDPIDKAVVACKTFRERRKGFAISVTIQRSSRIFITVKTLGETMYPQSYSL